VELPNPPKFHAQLSKESAFAMLLSTKVVGFPEQDKRLKKSATGLFLTVISFTMESEHPTFVVTFSEVKYVPTFSYVLEGDDEVAEWPSPKAQFQATTELPGGKVERSVKEAGVSSHNRLVIKSADGASPAIVMLNVSRRIHPAVVCAYIWYVPDTFTDMKVFAEPVDHEILLKPEAVVTNSFSLRHIWRLLNASGVGESDGLSTTTWIVSYKNCPLKSVIRTQ
jgi:hypothetical protein